MNILIISPGFVPMAGVGKMRMVSLAKYLRERHNVTVIHNRISSYADITDEKPIKNVRTIEADVKGKFISDFRAYKSALKKELALKKYDIILITVGPYFTLWLIKFIKRMTNISVIVDYRDLWRNSYRANEHVNELKSALKIYAVEKPSLKCVSGYTSCDEKSVAVLKEQYAFLSHVPSESILNGYDDAELNYVSVNNDVEYKNNSTVIGIYGKFAYYIGQDNLQWFVEELNKLIIHKNEEIKIIHYGNREEYFERVLKDTGIHYEWRGFVEYKVGMNALANEANVLMAANDVKIGYGTKIFDYIYLNKPVIMFAVEGSVSKEFVSSFENGYAFTNREELAEALEIIISNRPKQLTLKVDTKQYGRVVQNKKFEEFIESLVN